MKRDLRVVKTLSAIDKAFLELLQEKTFDQITIKEICDRAIINRATFYSHYTDKFQLIESYQETLVKGIREILYSNVKGTSLKEIMDKEVKFTIQNVLSFIKANKDKVLGVLESVDIATFAEYFSNHMFAFYKDKSVQLGIELESEIEKDYVITYITHAHMGIFLKWIQEGCIVPIETMSKYIETLTINGVFNALHLDEV
ncbi:TetR/AcrR family transcriptional regulator [Phocicoccus pinnipedialis]|uniref:HTH tetR-type domain-containing protein n=1 Tax=Phocicoccus pinnipedialis TaxID=110845 RepID=A0A6V7R5P6_9BACL|nr:TetR-like C-terminal domain-containing protein [Jeotgalicoccus pinnipedialis]MBP1939775.1 AcrR family transcriptional regulator [Jeotgalicoccus pinnipedialis]CAD2072403.1 hypothetical protein JEOPIN946_00496 [Jeotgalicoccus pinnipedialis]